MDVVRLLAGVCILTLSGQITLAQITPEELKSQIDARSGSLNGFQELLDDPDPRRSLAAVEGMLASGDANIERMALEFALTNPDDTIRATALAFHLAQLPVIAVSFDASALSDDESEALIRVLEALGGTVGPDKRGSFNFQAGPYSEALGCYPVVGSTRTCAMHLGAGSLSLYFVGGQVSGRWVNLFADETGLLKGGASFNYGSGPTFSLPLTVRLLN